MKHIQHLLCITGLTPQIVTETLYALHQARIPLPDHIHILSTQEGAERARLTLLQEGWLSRFYEDYTLPAPGLHTLHIETLNDPQGKPLLDVRTQHDNQAMADAITEKIRQLTEQDANALHVSIAGGRKTMGFYAGYALSLYGRQQDRLSHVLVSADYESHPQFFYPTPYSQVIYGNDPSRKPLDTRNAVVTLADIAFVRLRHGLDQHLLQGKSSFTESVQRAQQHFAAPHLIINRSRRCIRINQHDIPLKPADMAFYLWILYRQFSLQKPPCCPPDGAGDTDYATEYLQQLQALVGEINIAERTLNTLAKGMEKSFFEQHKSAVNSAIRKALDIHADNYLIHAYGKRPRTAYRVKLQAHQIEAQETP